jgi:hypothetical protein
MQTIYFTAKVPSPYSTPIGTQYDNGVTDITFQLPTAQDDDIDLTTATVHIAYQLPDTTTGSETITLSAITDGIASYIFAVPFTITPQCGEVLCTLSFHLENGNVWRTEQFSLVVSE